MTLKEYIGRNPERGAFSRIAEASGLSIMTVRRIYLGEPASKNAVQKVKFAMKKRVKLFAKPRKDKGMRREDYRKLAKAPSQS